MRLLPRGLLPRIVLALAIAGLAPVIFLAFRLVDLNREALITQVLQTHSVVADTAAERIGSYLEGWDAIGIAASSNADLFDDPRSPAAARVFQNLLGSRNDLIAAVITNAEGEEIVRAQHREYSDAVTSLLATSPLDPRNLDTIDGETWMVANYASSQRIAFLRLVIRAKEIDRALSPAEFSTEAEVVLVDGQKNRLAGVPTTLDAFPEELLTAAVMGPFKGSGRFENATGSMVLGSYSSVSATEWFIVSMQPASIAEAVAISVRRRAMVAVGAAVLLILVITLVAYSTIVKPVRRLIEAQRDLTQARPGKTSGNEIDALRESLDLLERRVKDRETIGEIFIGRYLAIDVLGEGGMGTVFRGWDPKLRREVALKTLHLGDRFDEDERGQKMKTLVDEAITLAQLHDERIVSVYDVEQSPGAAFIAMELITGMSLERYTWMHGRLDVSEAIVLGEAVARGLASAHQNNIVHRDIKEANILLGKNGSIKITDFGIASLVSSLHSQEGLIYGSPGYVAPEVVLGQPAGPESDLFSFGVLLYHSMTDILPFQRTSVPKTLRATVKDSVPPLRDHVDHLDPKVESLIEALLAKKPSDRPSNATEVAEILDDVALRSGWRWSFDSARRNQKPVTPKESVSELLPITIVTTNTEIEEVVP